MTNKTNDELLARLAKYLSLFDKPWKSVVIANVVSIIVTLGVMAVFGGVTWTGLLIAVICATLISYTISHVVISYQRQLTLKNTELEKRAEELLRVNQMLEESNADLRAFAHTLAHDLKTPITNTLGFTHIISEDLRKRGSDYKIALSMLDKIHESGVKMTSIIDEILLLASVGTEAVECHPIDMRGLLDEVEERLSTMVDEYDARIIRKQVWPAALGYGPWIEEVWVNYLSNAIKYGGTPPVIEVGADQLDGRVKFWVKDNGRGIALEDQADLFTEFTRIGQTNPPGYGLGLSIVSRIMKKLSGSYGIESTPGSGSTFYFTLPAAPPFETGREPAKTPKDYPVESMPVQQA